MTVCKPQIHPLRHRTAENVGEPVAGAGQERDFRLVQFGRVVRYGGSHLGKHYLGARCKFRLENVFGWIPVAPQPEGLCLVLVDVMVKVGQDSGRRLGVLGWAYVGYSNGVAPLDKWS
jgi:hypothetical protein